MGCAVGTTTRLRERRTGVRVQAVAREIFLVQKVQVASMSHCSCHLSDTMSAFFGGNNSPYSRADVKN